MIDVWFPKGSDCSKVKEDSLILTFTIDGLDYSLKWSDLVDEYRQNN